MNACARSRRDGEVGGGRGTEVSKYILQARQSIGLVDYIMPVICWQIPLARQRYSSKHIGNTAGTNNMLPAVIFSCQEHYSILQFQHTYIMITVLFARHSASRGPTTEWLNVLPLNRAPSSVLLLLVVRPGAPSSVLAPSSDARSP